MENPACNPHTLTGHDHECCSVDHPCGRGEGDCDKDDECTVDTICGTDNCGPDFPPGFDCCFNPGINRHLIVFC